MNPAPLTQPARNRGGRQEPTYFEPEVRKRAIRHAVRSNPQLVVVFTGSLHDPRSPKHLDKVLGMIHTLDIHDNWRVLGLIPKRDQVALLKEATTVIQPSLFEGWSTIVEEARLLNKRLIVSDIDVHREQAWDDVIFFDPHDARTLADAMTRARAEFAGVTRPPVQTMKP